MKRFLGMLLVLMLNITPADNTKNIFNIPNPDIFKQVNKKYLSTTVEDVLES